MEKLNQTATERRRITRNRLYRYLYDAPQGHSKQEMADDLTVKYCNLIRNGGCAECYNAETGAPLNNKGYTSTAGTFLILLHYYLR